MLGNLDELLGKGIDQLDALSKKLEEKSAKARRTESVDRIVASADRARRAVGKQLGCTDRRTERPGAPPDRSPLRLFRDGGR